MSDHETDATRDANFARLRALRADADELLRLRRRAAAWLAGRSAASLRGLGELATAVIPSEAARRLAIARALRVSPGLLDDVHRGRFDAFAWPAEALATLGQALGLDRETFMILVARNHARGMGDLGLAAAATPASYDPAARHAAAGWTRMEVDRDVHDDAPDT